MTFYIMSTSLGDDLVMFAQELIDNGHTLTSDPEKADEIIIDLGGIGKKQFSFVENECLTLPMKRYVNWKNFIFRRFFK